MADLCFICGAPADGYPAKVLIIEEQWCPYCPDCKDTPGVFETRDGKFLTPSEASDFAHRQTMHNHGLEVE